MTISFALLGAVICFAINFVTFVKFRAYTKRGLNDQAARFKSIANISGIGIGVCLALALYLAFQG